MRCFAAFPWLVLETRTEIPYARLFGRRLTRTPQICGMGLMECSPDLNARQWGELETLSGRARATARWNAEVRGTSPKQRMITVAELAGDGMIRFGQSEWHRNGHLAR